MHESRSIHDVVATALTEMGFAADSLLRTILIQDGYFLGEKYRFDGGCAIWVASSDVVEVYGDDGTLARTFVAGDQEESAA